MDAREAGRPDPDQLLARVQQDESRSRRGRLKVLFGACPGVGKTFAMLAAAQRLAAQGVDVVVGIVEAHGRSDTVALLQGLEVLPRRSVDYRGTQLSEFDLDAALARRPAILLVDELAHTNAPGSRFEKRWQDVRALLDAQIDVHTTMNVQHVESLNDVVARITGVVVRETVPDAVLDEADEVEVVDLAPDVLLERLRAGKVYVPEAALAAASAFFRKEHLAALRELALRKTAQLVDQRRREERKGTGGRRMRSTFERVLVCVGPSPFSARLVRAAHRMAAVVRGELFAVHVTRAGSRPLSPQDRERVLQNLRIAESLGARTASIEGEDAARAIVGFAESHEISRVVVGKSGRSRLRELLSGSFTMDVIRHSRELDVYVIHGDAEAETPAAAVDASPRAVATAGGWRQSAWALVASALTVVFAWLLYDPPDLSVEALVLTLGVVVVARRCGRWHSAASALVMALAFNFLFVEPRFTFAIAEPSYLLAFGVMLVVGVSLSSLVAAVRERGDAARDREAEVTALHSLSRELADAQTHEDIGRITISHLRDVVVADMAMFVVGPGRAVDLAGVVAAHGGTDWLGPAEIAVARWSWEHGVPAGLGTGNLSGTPALFLPLRSARGKEGVLGLRPKPGQAPWGPKQRLLVDTFTEQAARACERLGLAEERQRVGREAEAERMRSTLLASVSHDLRTPLATITGASSSLLDEGTQDPRVRHELLLGIHTEAQRLNELIGNLVFATRLEAGKIALRFEWTSLEEVVGAALHRLRDALADRPVQVDVAAGLPLLQADPALLEQAVYLLLENATRHTPPGTPVRVRAFVLGSEAAIEVADDGPGIAEADRQRVFQRFVRGPRSAGMGLGLPICEAILKAHGGGAVLMPTTGRGAVFQLRLPLPTAPPPSAPEATDAKEGDHG